METALALGGSAELPASGDRSRSWLRGRPDDGRARGSRNAGHRLRFESRDGETDAADARGRGPWRERAGRPRRRQQLALPSGSARLVVALGVIPWLSEPQRAVQEMARVLEPGGWLILTADNALRLNRLTDPAESPLAAPLRPAYRALRAAVRAPGRSGDGGVPSPSALPGQPDAGRGGAPPCAEATVGFGPFTFMGRTFLRDDHSLALNRRLEGWAQRHARLRRCGWHYLVAAQRLG